MIVTLDREEMLQAIRVGVRRGLDNILAKLSPQHGLTLADGNGWDLHIEGAAAERAFAKYADLPWDGNIGLYRAADVGRYEIRTTTRERGRLILHPSDNDNAPFVLLVGMVPRFRIAGWIYGWEGKQFKWWRDPTKQGRWAYFVPQEALRKVRVREAA